MVKWADHVVLMRETRSACKLLVGKPEGRRSLGRTKRRWKDNIELYLTEVGCEVWTGFICLRIGTSGGLL
jgi:hypothetical protein